MASQFSNMAFIWWFKALREPDKNPIIKWWVESDFPWDYLAFLDNGSYFDGASVSEKEVLSAWMSIGMVQNGLEDREQFVERYKKGFPPVSRKHRILGIALIPIFLMGILYLSAVWNIGSTGPIQFLQATVGATVLSALDYHRLYRRLINGRILSKWSPLITYFLLAFVVFSLTMGFSTILTYAFPSAVFYVDMAHYPIILRMLANAAEFLVILLAVLLVGEIYLRASLSLIRRKMAA